MYAAYWGLAESPFKNTLDPRWFFESQGHEEALARLLYLVEQRRRCGLVSGVAGTGKSLVLEVLRSQAVRSGSHVALVDLVGRTARELLWETLAGLGFWPGADDAPHRLWRRVQEHIAANRFARFSLVLLFDHLDRAQPECIVAIERLAQLSAGGQTGLTLILASRNQQAPEMLHQVSDVRIDLGPIEREQIRQHVETLLARAGAERPIFDESAFDRLYDETRGIPRQINRLCELALLAGMAEQVATIGEPIIAAAADDLHQRRPAARLVGEPRPRFASV